MTLKAPLSVRPSSSAKVTPKHFKIAVAKTKHPKCPRCYRYLIENNYNFDNLCDRCCSVILNYFPNHASVPYIKAKLAEQKSWTAAQWRARNREIDPEKWA
jgi:hypothetical protein